MMRGEGADALPTFSSLSLRKEKTGKRQRRRAGSKDSLWPDVKAEGERQLSSAWSKWFGRYVRKKCGVSDSAKVFHSFRHTFKRMTRDAELPEELHDALTGHAGNGGVGRTYGRGVSLKPLVRAIDKVRSPVVLNLRWGRS